MVDWCRTCFYHLPQVLDEWDRELAGRPAEPEESEADPDDEAGGGDAFRLTPEDRIRHVEQSLKGLAVHLGEVESDEKTFTRLRRELRPLLDELGDRAGAELDEDGRTDWHDEWSKRVAVRGRSLLVAKTAEPLYHAFSKLRRRALALGKAFAASGTLDREAWAALRSECPPED